MKKSRALLAGIIGVGIGLAGQEYLKSKEIDKKERKIDKFKNYYNLLNQWLLIKQEGKSLGEYFKQNNYKSIAIYGMGELGNRLYDELKDTDVKVVCGIDKNINNVYCDVSAYSVEEAVNLTKTVDAIVVTAIFAFDEIEGEISSKFDCSIVSLEDVVYSI